MARPIEVLGDPEFQLLPGAFPSSLEPKAILSSLAERTSQILDATRCSIVRVDPSRHPGKAFVFTATDDPSIEGYTLDLKDYPEIQAALERNAPILMRDLPDDEVAAQIRARHRRLPFPVSLAIPLSYRGESFGVLFLRFSDPHHPISREAVMFCQLIAFGAAVALNSAREYEHLLAEVERREHEAQALADANRMQLETLSSASHDIRVPLNSIIGYTDLLLEGLYGEVPPGQREVLERVLDNARNLLEIVNTLIDHARLEQGQVPLEVSPGEVATLFDDLRVVLEPLVQRRDLELSFQVCGAVPRVRTDWPKLKRVLLNLLHNAVKFTERGRVSLTATGRDGRIEFEVSDTGAGIPPEQLSELFSQWRRVAPRSAAEPGGLGLAIAKRYADLLRGRLSVASELGKGTRFTLSIPVEWEDGGSP